MVDMAVALQGTMARTAANSSVSSFLGLTPEGVMGMKALGIKPVDEYLLASDNGDWALAFARALAVNPVITSSSTTALYPFKSQLLITTSAFLDLNHSKIIMNGNITPIMVNYLYLNEQAISNITTATVDLSIGQAGVTTVSVVTVANASGYAVNDVVKVCSDDLYPYNDPTDNERLGEFVTVSQIVGNQIYFYSILINTYTTSPRIARMDRSKKLVMKNIGFGTSASATPSWSEASCSVFGAYSPVIDRIIADETVAEVFELAGCYNVRGTNSDGVGLRTDESENAFGYLFTSLSSAHGTFSGNYTSDARHLYADGVKGTQPGGDIRFYGGSSYDIITDNHMMNMQNAGLDSHASGFGHQYCNNTIVYSFNGPYGGNRGIAVRGNNHIIKGNIVYGGTGYEAFTNYGVPLNSGGHLFESNVYVQNPKGGTTRSPYGARGRVGTGGGPDSIVTATFKDNLSIVTASGSASAYYAERANIQIINPDIRHVLNTNNSGLIEFSEGSTVAITGGRYDVTGSTGTTVTLFKPLTANTSLTQNGYSQIIGGANLTTIINATNLASTIHVRGLDSDTTFGVAAVNTTGATITVDYITNGGRTLGFNTRSAATLTTGSNTLDLQFRSMPTVFVRLRALTAGCEVNSITAGTVIGQTIMVTNRTDSSQSITLKNGGTRMSIVADIVLAVGQAVQLVWDATNWVRAS